MTRHQWDNLSEKAKWDIKVALRGPDCMYGEVLKWFTTGVIRGQLKEVFRVGGTINSDLKLIVVPGGSSEELTKAFSRAGPVAWNCYHFTDHVITAAHWMGIPVLLVEPNVWHKAIQERTATTAGTRIIEAAEAFNQYSEQKSYNEFYKSSQMKELKRHLESGKLNI